MNDQYIITILKITLIIYMLLTPYIKNDFIIYTFDNMISKLLFIGIVVAVTYYDNGLGILLTLSYILSINYRLPKYYQYKKEYN